jgi:hypothetical protein
MKKIDTYWFLIIAGFFFFSCNQDASIQSYYVEKLEDPSFLIINVPFQFNNVFNQKLTAEDQKAISSVEKFNLLFYRVKENQNEIFKNELAVVENILSQNRYQNLMDFKIFKKAQGRLLFEGEMDKIKEGIVFFSSDEIGFVVLRILGSKISPTSLIGLVEKIDPVKFEDQFKFTLGSLGNVFKDIDLQ